ncbi:MAG: MFS transporter, partial [Armatimonadetes bacterium]|nr:MFS transporter [Armatimonadota bacterium]
MATELVYALLPAFYATTLGLNALWQGIIEGCAEAIASLTKLFSGHWSDRSGGRKWWMVAGYSLSGLSKPLLPLAGGAAGVMVLRGFDRLGKGIRSAPRDAILSREVQGDQWGRAFGLQRAMDHAGALTGSLVASALMFFGVVTLENLSRLFWWTLLPSGLAVVLILLFVHEKEGAVSSTDVKGQETSLSLKSALRALPPSMRRYLVVLAIFSLGNSTDALLLLRARNQMTEGGLSLHTATALMPMLWAWLHVVKSLSSTQGGPLSDRLGRRKLVSSGWALYALVYCGFALWSGPLAPWVLFGVYGVYYGLVEGPERALVADLCPDPDRRG